jgi:D-alanyl-lipoteichoic acid acyltransferase DltB (MBOAT superfamily)
MKGVSKVAVGMVTVFVAVFALFWIFDTIQKFADQCKTDPSTSPVCSQLTSFTLSMILILLIVGGFVIMITATAYILLSG